MRSLTLAAVQVPPGLRVRMTGGSEPAVIVMLLTWSSLRLMARASRRARLSRGQEVERVVGHGVDEGLGGIADVEQFVFVLADQRG